MFCVNITYFQRLTKKKKKMKMKKKEEEKKITEVNRLIFICYVTKLRKCRIWKKR